jgi:Immunoglobulin-like domain of bacterial spore germination
VFGWNRVDGAFSGTTDEIIQRAACKWGIDEDIVRAQIIKESYWYQSTKRTSLVKVVAGLDASGMRARIPSRRRCVRQQGGSTSDGDEMSGEDDLTSQDQPAGQGNPSNQGEVTSSSDDTMIDTDHKRRGIVILVIVVVAVASAIAVILAIDAWGSSDDETLVPAESAQTSANGSKAPATSSPTSTTAEATEPTAAPSTAAASSTPATAPASSAPATTASATSAPAASPSATGSPVPSEPAPVDPLSQAVWPSPNSDIRYSDPVEAVRAFAVDFVGFVGANFGEFRPADSRSGEVEVRVGEAGPPTVVFVRQLADDDSWWVTGSGTQNIVVQQPDALTTIESPLTINGLAQAFEGMVEVELRADDTDQPLFTGFVTGGDGSELEPFEETFEFDSPPGGGGTLVLTTFSADNDNVLDAEVLRYFFAAG